jgi:hypothetical protein
VVLSKLRFGSQIVYRWPSMAERRQKCSLDSGRISSPGVAGATFIVTVAAVVLIGFAETLGALPGK